MKQYIMLNQTHCEEILVDKSLSQTSELWNQNKTKNKKQQLTEGYLFGSVSEHVTLDLGIMGSSLNVGCRDNIKGKKKKERANRIQHPHTS